MDKDLLRIGCAGWSLRREQQASFPDAASQLHRYAAVFSAVEVNSCFYRSHRHATWARWAESTPENFRFSYKLPKSITHQARLKNSYEPVCRFLDEVMWLGARQGVLLVQLPPSLTFDVQVVGDFFAMLKRVGESHAMAHKIACEPRHASWFTPEASRLLQEFEVTGVAAHPPRSAQHFAPFGDTAHVYYRLHGSPHVYRSAYSEADLLDLAGRLTSSLAAGVETWCIFDNTADGHAVDNVLRLLQILSADDSVEM